MLAITRQRDGSEETTLLLIATPEGNRCTLGIMELVVRLWLMLARPLQGNFFNNTVTLPFVLVPKDDRRCYGYQGGY